MRCVTGFDVMTQKPNTIGPDMTDQSTKDWLAAHPDTEWITVALRDLNGVLRGKRLPRAQIKKALSGGVRMPQSACAIDIWGYDIAESELVFESGDADGICLPTDRGIVERSWKTPPSAVLPVMMADADGAPLAADGRQALAAVVARFAALGLKPVVATELEFHLTKIEGGQLMPSSGRSDIAPTANVLSVSTLDDLSPFLDDFY